jgi:hypothetical protein
VVYKIWRWWEWKWKCWTTYTSREECITKERDSFEKLSTIGGIVEDILDCAIWLRVKYDRNFLLVIISCAIFNNKDVGIKAIHEYYLS